MRDAFAQITTTHSSSFSNNFRPRTPTIGAAQGDEAHFFHLAGALRVTRIADCKVSSKLLLQKVVKVDALSLPPLAGLGGVTIKTLFYV